MNRSAIATPDAHRAAAGLAVRKTGDAHHPAHSLNDEVIAGAIGIRAVLAKAGDRGIDQPRIGGAQRFCVEPELLEAADFEIFDDDVGLLRELANQRRALPLGKIDCCRFLSAIGS